MVKGQKPAPKYETPEELKEEARDFIKDFLKKENITLVQLAEKLKCEGQRPTSRTNLLNKLARASFSLTEVMQILKLYGYKISVEKSDRTTKDGNSL